MANQTTVHLKLKDEISKELKELKTTASSTIQKIADTQKQIAASNSAVAKSALVVKKATDSLAKAKTDLARIQNQANPDKTELANAKAIVKQEKLKVAEAKEQKTIASSLVASLTAQKTALKKNHSIAKEQTAEKQKELALTQKILEVEKKTAISFNQRTEQARKERINSQRIDSSVNKLGQKHTVSASGYDTNEELSKMREFYLEEEKRSKESTLLMKQEKIAKEEKTRDSILAMSREGKANLELKNKMKQLDNAYKQGIITKAQYNKVSRQVAQDMKESSAVRNSAVNNLVRHIRQIETMIVTLYLFSTAWRNTLGAGVEFNKIIENNSYGLAALISSNTDYVNSQGKVLNSGKKFIASLELSRKTMLDIKEASKETSATFPELTQVFQQAIGYSLKMGTAFAANTQQAIDRTIELTTTLTNMGSAVGMNAELVLEETRSLFSGDTSRDSKLAILLFGSPTQANLAIKQAKDGVGQYANNVFGLLKDQLKEFENLNTIDTLQRNIDKAKAEWETLMGAMAEPLNEDFKEVLKEIRVAIAENGEEWVSSFKAAYAAIKEVAPLLKEVLVAALAYKAISWGSALGISAWTTALDLYSRGSKSIATTSAATAALGVNASKTTRLTSKLGRTMAGLKGIVLANPFTAWVGALTLAYTLVQKIYSATNEQSSKWKNFRSDITAANSEESLKKIIADMRKQKSSDDANYNRFGVNTSSAVSAESQKALSFALTKLKEISATQKENLALELKSIDNKILSNKKYQESVTNERHLLNLSKELSVLEKQRVETKNKLLKANNTMSEKQFNSNLMGTLKARINLGTETLKGQLESLKDKNAVSKLGSYDQERVEVAKKEAEEILKVLEENSERKAAVRKKEKYGTEALSKEELELVNTFEKYKLEVIKASTIEYAKIDKQQLEDQKTSNAKTFKDDVDRTSERLSLQKEYYKSIGNYAKAWKIEETTLKAEYSELGVNPVLADKYIEREKVEFFKEANEEKKQIVEDFNDSYLKTTLSTFEYEKLKLTQQVEEYKKYIDDKSQADVYYHSKLKALQDTENERVKKQEQEKREKSNSVVEGMEDSIRSYVEKSSDMYSQSNSFFNTTMQSMEDAVFQFSTTGKLSFKDFATSVIQDIIKIQQRKLIAGIVGNILGSFSFGAADATAMSSVPETSSMLGTGSGFANGGEVKKFADGGYLTGGSGVKDDLYLGSASGSHVFAMGGEYIVNKNAVNSMGVGAMDYINETGSLPTSVSQSPDVKVTINIENNTSEDISAEQISEMTKTNEQGEQEKIITMVIDAVSRNKNNSRTSLKGLLK